MTVQYIHTSNSYSNWSKHPLLCSAQQHKCLSKVEAADNTRSKNQQGEDESNTFFFGPMRQRHFCFVAQHVTSLPPATLFVDYIVHD